jgi:acyl-coenzyme A thioesterase PaaI-like protein
VNETSPRWRATVPDALGMVHKVQADGRVRGHFAIERRNMAANGFLHAAMIVALEDLACGSAA